MSFQGFSRKIRLKILLHWLKKDCLPGFTLVQKEESVIMFRLEIEPKSNIPVVNESISIKS